MNKSTVTNKEIVEAFKAAKGNLRDGIGNYVYASGTKYICHAIRQSGKISYHVKDAAVAVIQDRLKGYSTVIEWLVKQPNVNLEDLSDQRIQSYRHAWLSSLIKEFSK